MSRHVVVNGRELSMNDVGFIDPNSEWSVTVGEDGSVEVNRLDLKEENAKLRELAKEACELARVFCYCGGTFNDLDDLLCEASELGIEVDG